MTSPGLSPGLLIVGHGTRDPAGQAEFLELAQAVAERFPAWAVEACCLEFAEPTIAQGLARLVARGASERITIAPLLLFAAGHAQADIPQAVAREAANYPRLSLRQAAQLGVHSALIELSRRRFEQALAGLSPIAAEETLLVFVGRGSRDAAANAELARFARLRWEACPTGGLETCFASMAEPSLEHSLAWAAGLSFRRVVVQPHLLFRGELLARINRTVAGFADEHPQIEWTVAPHLGPDKLAAEAVAERIRAAEF